MRHLFPISLAVVILARTLCAQATPQSSTPNVTSEPATLELGKPIERELHANETHSYKIHVEAGQFLHVVVLQKGVDVAVTLRDPSGKEIVKSDSPNGAYGPEPVSTIATVSGEYQLQIEAGEEPPGLYEVRLADLGPPTTSDRTRMDAERGFMQGAGLYVRGDAQSLKSAVEKCQDSFRLYESIGDKYGQGLSLYTAGLALAALGDNQKALDYFGQALPLRRAVGDRKGEADVLDNIGVVYDALSEQQKSLEYFTQALPVYRSIGDHGGEATALNNIGSQYDRLGDMQKGLEYYLQALELNHGTGSRMSEAATLDNIAVLYYELGELQKALDYESKALLLYRQLGHRIGEAAALNNMGAIYRDLGQNDKAIDYLQQALPVSRAAGDRDGEAATLTQIGRVYAILGQNPKALEYYQQALQLNRAVGDRDQEAGTLRRMADAYRALGENREALDSYGQALSLYHLIQDPLYEAGLLVSFMDYWKTQGKPSLAILFGKQGIDRFQEIRKNIQGLPKAEQESFVRSNEDYYRKLADLLVGQGRLPEAQEVLDLLKVEEYSEFSHRRGGPNSPVEPVTRTRTEQVTEQAGDAIQQDVIALGQRWLELKRKTSRTPEEETQFEQLSLKLDDANKRWKTYIDVLYDIFGKG